MTYEYQLGTAVPCAAGLVDFGGLRVNKGTFITNKIVGVQDTPTPIYATQGLAADHGDYMSETFYGPRNITVEASVWDPIGGSLDNVDAAVEQLRDVWVRATRGGGLNTIFHRNGWGNRRQALCRLSDQVIVDQPDQGSTRKPWRELLIPLVAADPRLYNADVLRLIDIDPNIGYVSTPNEGNFDTPMMVDFYGPFTTMSLIDDANSRSMAITSPVPAGDFIRLRTAEKTATRATNNSNWYGNMDGDFFNLPSDGLSLRVVTTGATSETTQALLTYRDAWL